MISESSRPADAAGGGVVVVGSMWWSNWLGCVRGTTRPTHPCLCEELLLVVVGVIVCEEGSLENIKPLRRQDLPSGGTVESKSQKLSIQKGSCVLFAAFLVDAAA
jgi:hypothetical protein